MKRRRKVVRRLERLPPPALLALLYLAAVLSGSALLMLPFARTAPITLSDALFTATSAVTVTGLVVVDTGSVFTLAGQAIIAILIQLGGLGLMTFGVLLFSILGLPIGLPQKTVLREDLNQTSMRNIVSLAGLVLRVALICEAVGVAVLATVFVPEFGWVQGVWHAVFHTVSAFNNAGFALWPDGLSRYVGDPVINLAIPFMFILGGLGFVVIGDIWVKRRWHSLLLHSKLMLAGTLGLCVLATILFALLEWDNPGTLGGLGDTGDRLWAAWFQAVTPRTAGFNTIDTSAMNDATTLMTISLMLIGGGSTSTAGGIKVTTFIVLLLATVAFFKRRKELHAFGRSLGVEAVFKVMALTTICILWVMLSLFILSIHHNGDFLRLAFEVTSAFGTVGLSQGETGQLDALGRAIIMLTMFVGRVGPLTLGFFLATRSVPRVRYPKGEVFLG